MQITFLGHAGFLVETQHALVVADPWLSPQGAFDSAWMQFPRNHQLAPMVRQKLEHSPKERFLYISHEHKDHYDPDFLRTLTKRDFTVVIARFRRTALRNDFEAYGARRVIACEDQQEVPFKNGYLKLYLTDSGTNRDSALLIQADGQSFLNLNDCKVHDRLPGIVAEEGPLDIFTAQFSGAIWHPTCYDYSREAYAEHSRRKRASKFEAVARAIETVRPRVYLASAGPACFLDPSLFHINLEPVNIFPRASELFTFLHHRLAGKTPRLLEPMPGDVLDAGIGDLISLAPERVTDENVSQYLRSYATLQTRVFRERRRNLMLEEVDRIHERLREEMQNKLESFSLADRVTMPLYLGLIELPGQLIRVDFRSRRVEVVSEVRDLSRYTLITSAPDIVRVLDRKLNWEDFLLSFRFRASRSPDVYDASLHNFLAAEVEDLRALCDNTLANESRKERTVVTAGGQRYAINRYCPHQGADLQEGWVEEGRFLVCPRHRWRFDLTAEGLCPMNGCSINAEPLGKDKDDSTPGTSKEQRSSM
ncbi:Rieske 2Fe-2S domain-containing protein [Vitiosangium sp. GDMCC 1.1324]|uniref:Rieske 2Fe-2S domain-containing protein n=1 Tax=Vitiosangium sp. (strain GDMCC 1.1324) TaxID=2138576 RepID=UPI000D3B6A8B|nr:Rieske 2Fe-2S domain-containing protein [Vitiosangium sp. GDMCC 1.1324]PTL76926.1 (2Fe-2S)-binding protein [Vitiosangium sp. GDMCC 1.1324]